MPPAYFGLKCTCNISSGADSGVLHALHFQQASVRHELRGMTDFYIIYFT